MQRESLLMILRPRSTKGSRRRTPRLGGSSVGELIEDHVRPFRFQELAWYL